MASPEPSQYFAADPATPSRRGQVTLRVGTRILTLATDRGVFSAERVDPGSLVLLDQAPPPAPGHTALDLGCGYGPIALSLAAQAPKARVWAIDVNARALALTAANAEANGLTNIAVCAVDDMPHGLVFDGIWSNPPIHVGKAELHAILRRWLPRLSPEGVAWLVVQRHLGSDSLARWLRDERWDVDRVASRKGYRVLKVTRPA